jgi:hypothetical protein
MPKYRPVELTQIDYKGRETLLAELARVKEREGPFVVFSSVDWSDTEYFIIPFDHPITQSINADPKQAITLDLNEFVRERAEVKQDGNWQQVYFHEATQTPSASPSQAGSELDLIVLALLSRINIDKASTLLDSQDEVMAVDSHDLPLRLFRPNDKAVNLEVRLDTPIGSFFKAVGCYMEHDEIILLNEFKPTLMKLADADRIDKSISVSPLSDEANAVIAAFSIATLMQLEEGEEEAQFTSNGLSVELSSNFLGCPQVRVNSDIEEKKVALSSDPVEPDLKPNVPYMDVYSDLKGQSVLSMYKQI